MKVSVVVATFGDCAWARSGERAVASLEGQDAYEVIVLHRAESSLAEVRNEAASRATGDWLCHVDADDELEPGYFDAMAVALESNPAGIWEDDTHYEELWTTPPLLVPAVRYVGPPTRTPPAPQFPNRGRWPELNECVIGTLVRRDLFERVGGFRSHSDDGTELTLYEDWDLFLRCHDAGSSLVYVEDAVYRAYVNPRGLGRNQGPNARTVYDAIWADHETRIAGLRPHVRH